jgi:micrococcal nuclease
MTHQNVRCAIIVFVIPIMGAALASGGKVVAIGDGDTLTILTPDNQQIKIRLAEIDTPERGQPYANHAKQALAELVFGKTVAILPIDTDRYRRTVCQ